MNSKISIEIPEKEETKSKFCSLETRLKLSSNRNLFTLKFSNTTFGHLLNCAKALKLLNFRR